MSPQQTEKIQKALVVVSFLQLLREELGLRQEKTWSFSALSTLRVGPHRAQGKAAQALRTCSKSFLKVALECNQDVWMPRPRYLWAAWADVQSSRRGVTTSSSSTRFHTNSSYKCVAERPATHLCSTCTNLKALNRLSNRPTSVHFRQYSAVPAAVSCQHCVGTDPTGHPRACVLRARQDQMLDRGRVMLSAHRYPDTHSDECSTQKGLQAQWFAQ